MMRLWPWPRETRADNLQSAKVNDPAALARILHGGGISDSEVQESLRNAHKNNPTVAASILRITTAAKSVPVNVKQAQRDQLVDAALDHPLKKLLDHPNDWDSWDYITEHVLGSFVLKGEAYLLLNGRGQPFEEATPSQVPLEILPVSPDQVEPVMNPKRSEILGFRVQTGSGAGEMWHPSRVVYIRTWNPDDLFRGLPMIHPAAKSIAITDEGRDWNWRLLHNMGRPPGGFETDTELSDKAYERLDRQLKSKFSGKHNAGTPLLLEGGLKWQSEMVNPVDMDWIDGLRESKREITTNLLVAPELVGDPDVKTYANAEAARAALYDDTVFPLLEHFYHALTRAVRRWWPDVQVVIDADDVPAVQERRRKAWTDTAGLVRDGILTRNEARQAMGFEALEVPEADMLFVPMSQVPLGEGGDDAGEDAPDDDQDEERGHVQVLNGKA